MSARRPLAPLLLLLGCRGGEADDDSTIDPGGPADHAGEPPVEFAFGPAQTSNVFAYIDLQLGDLDADGCADLVTSGSGAPPRLNLYVPGNDWVVQLYANLGPSFAAEPQLFPGFGFLALRSADLDADGRDDLILSLAGQPPRVATWLSQ